MSLITLIFTLVIIGVVMWLINAYVPMEPGIKRILNIAVIIFVILWLASALLGVNFQNLSNIRVGG